ncbi:hypothetical protein B0H16DRAFT_859622 [Mycena metata]|uniref:Uncharacterized protein n=1 Tax=Mycena metata TaxID=1033252 RepID=A0AAD7N7Q1_9AGAR|nr:hypothetical protein B0H16DRAFT_859622 [Mycena metata]
MTLSNLHPLLDVDAKCAHTHEWDRLCTEVVILTQILSTLPQKAAFDPDSELFEKRKSQKLLTHFVHTLYYTPSEKQMGTPVIAAALSGSMVSVLEQPSTNSALTVSENIRRKGSESSSHAYVAQEVTHLDRTAKQIVTDETPANNLNEQVADVLKAITDGDVIAAEQLVVFRSMDWIQRRLRDPRIFKAQDLNSEPLIMTTLSALRPSPDAQVNLPVSDPAAATQLWGLSEEEKTLTRLPATILFTKLEKAVADVFKAQKAYEKCAKTEKNSFLAQFCFVLARLHEFVRRKVYEDLFTSPTVQQAATEHINPYPASHDTSTTHRLGMRALHYLRKIVQPIRSLQVVMMSQLPSLLQAGTLDVYTIHQDNPIPDICVADLIDFQKSFVVPQRDQLALDRLILRAFFSKASLKSQLHHVPRDDVADGDEDLSSALRQLNALHEFDQQAWDEESLTESGSHGSISTTSSAPSSDLSDGANSVISLTPSDGVANAARHSNEASSGSSSDGMRSTFSFYRVCNALQKADVPVRCMAARHAECLLMASLRIVEGANADERACATTKRPCFSCKMISEALDHPMPTTHGIIFPWVPPCGLPLADLKHLRNVLVVKLEVAAKERGKINTTGSGSDTSSIASPIQALPERDWTDVEVVDV